MKVVDFKPKVAESMKDAAVWLREIADRCEKGEITEVIVVVHDSEGAQFENYGAFTDRWRILGALEYAKSAVHDS